MRLFTTLMSAAITLGLTGCTSTFFATDSRLCIGDNGVYQRCEAQKTGLADAKKLKMRVAASVEEQQRELSMLSKRDDQRLFKPRYDHKLLADYVEQLAMKLVDSMAQRESFGPIAITSFVQFDSTLNRADVLGNQLAELFFRELQQFGIAVVDHKATKFIKVTSTGDFLFSRDVKQLQHKQSFGYVLSGTLLASDRGVIVNARIIGLEDNDVIATARGLIPNFVLPPVYSG